MSDAEAEAEPAGSPVRSASLTLPELTTEDEASVQALLANTPRRITSRQRSSIGVSAMKEEKVRREKQQQAHQAAIAAQKVPTPLARETVEAKMKELLAAEMAGGPIGRDVVLPVAPTSPSHGRPASRRVQSANQASRAFLQSVLAQQKGQFSQVPAWKEELVARVARRATPSPSTSRPASAMPHPPSRPSSSRAASARGSRSGLSSAAASPRVPTRPQSSRGSSANGEASASASAAHLERVEQRLHEIHHYKDKFGSEQLVAQFLDADLAEAKAQFLSIRDGLQVAAGRKGVLSLRGGADMSAAKTLMRQNAESLHVVETRLGEALYLNKELEKTIRQLRCALPLSPPSLPRRRRRCVR